MHFCGLSFTSAEYSYGTSSSSNRIIGSNNPDELCYSRCGEELNPDDQTKFKEIETRLFHSSLADESLPGIFKDLSILSAKYSETFNEDSITKWAIEFFTSVIKSRVAPQAEVRTSSVPIGNKRHLLEAAIIQEYAKVPVCYDSRVVLLSCVLSDGFGDYFNLINFLKSLEQTSYRPRLDVIVAVSDKPEFTSILERIPLPVLENMTVALIVKKRIGEEHCWRWNSSHISPFDNPVVIGLPYTVACDSLSRGFGSYQIINEMGAHHNNPVSLVFNRFQIGINTGELNYFAPSLVVSGRLSQEEKINQFLMHQPEGLLDKLMGEENPSLESVLNFFQTNRMYIGYFKYALGLEAYVNVIAKTCQSDEKTINVITKSYLPKFHLAYLSDMGIGRIEVYSPSNPMQEIEVCSLNTKVLRLFQYLPMPFEQYIAIRCVCESLEGCTGNNSFCESLALGHLPFYEVSVDFTRPYFSETIPLFIQDSTLSNYYKQMVDLRCERGDHMRKKDLLCCEKLGIMLRDRKIYEAQRLFSDQLQAQYSSSRYAEGVIKRGVLMKHHALKIRLIEEQVTGGYIEHIVVEDRLKLFNSAILELLKEVPES